MAVPTHQGTPDLDTRIVFVAGLTAVILFVVTVIGVQAGFQTVWNHEVYTKVVAPSDPELTDLRAAQHKQIETYQWRDKDHRLVSVPVEDAMARMLKQSGRKGEGSGSHQAKASSKSKSSGRG